MPPDMTNNTLYPTERAPDLAGYVQKSDKFTSQSALRVPEDASADAECRRWPAKRAAWWLNEITVRNKSRWWRKMSEWRGIGAAAEGRKAKSG